MVQLRLLLDEDFPEQQAGADIRQRFFNRAPLSPSTSEMRDGLSNTVSYLEDEGRKMRSVLGRAAGHLDGVRSHDLLPDTPSKGGGHEHGAIETGRVAEKYLRFSLAALQRYDPELDSVPECRDALGSRLEDVVWDEAGRQLPGGSIKEETDFVLRGDDTSRALESKVRMEVPQGWGGDVVERYGGTGGFFPVQKALALFARHGDIDGVADTMRQRDDWALLDGDDLARLHREAWRHVSQDQGLDELAVPIRSASSLYRVPTILTRSAQGIYTPSHRPMRSWLDTMYTENISSIKDHPQEASDLAPAAYSYELSGVDGDDEDDRVYLAVETAQPGPGFDDAASMIGQAAVGRYHGTGLSVDVYNATNPLEEKRLLQQVRGEIDEEHVVMLGGESGGKEYVERRMTMNRVQPGTHDVHDPLGGAQLSYSPSGIEAEVSDVLRNAEASVDAAIVAGVDEPSPLYQAMLGDQQKRRFSENAERLCHVVRAAERVAHVSPSYSTRGEETRSSADEALTPTEEDAPF